MGKPQKPQKEHQPRDVPIEGALSNAIFSRTSPCFFFAKTETSAARTWKSPIPQAGHPNTKTDLQKKHRRKQESEVAWENPRVRSRQVPRYESASDRSCTHNHTHAQHEYHPNQLAFADLVTAKLPLAENAADVVALISACKVPFVQLQPHVIVQSIYLCT